MTLGTGIRFRDKKRILAQIDEAMTLFAKKGLIKEVELTELVKEIKETLITANSPSTFDVALTNFFKKFPVFTELERREQIKRLEEIEQGITKVLMESENINYMENLKVLDANEDQLLFQWIQGLSPWGQSRVYDYLANSSN